MAPPAEAVCPVTPLAAGERFIGPVICASLRIGPDGEGTSGDVFLGNARFRAVLRTPLASLTLPGLGGGTLVDLAPWGVGDLVHEVVPIVGGGWLATTSLEPVEGGVRVRGTVQSLPDRLAWAEGETREVTWRIHPDDPWIEAEGAESLWIHPSSDLVLIDGWLADDRAVIGHDGLFTEDLGGAIVAWGAHRLLVAPPEQAWAERPGPSIEVAGAAAEATQVELRAGGELVGTLPVRGGRFAARIPARVDALVATAPGRAASLPRPPSPDTVLALGPPGTVLVRLGWAPTARARPLEATWTRPDGRTGSTRVAPSGAELPTGPGPVELRLDAGPLWTPWTGRVEVPEDGTVDLDVALTVRVTSARHILTDLAWPGSRSREVRGTALQRARAAVAHGLDHVVFVAEDDVETGAAFLDDRPWLSWEDGVVLTSPQGWSVASWPWRATADRSGHGAPRARELDPLAALRAAWGGAAVDRTTAVDLPWLGALPVPPALVEPTPDFVRLASPGAPPFASWAPWFTWLDAGRFVRPGGPRTWLDVGSAASWATSDVERALTLGQLSSGTGAWLDLSVGGAGPGQIVPPPAVDTDPDTDTDPDSAPDAVDTSEPEPVGAGLEVIVSVQAADTSIDQLTLWSGGLGELRTFTIAQPGWSWQGRLEVGTWVIAIGWSTTGSDWVVSMPVWTRSPTQPEVTP